MDPDLIDRALTVDRLARRAAVGEALASEVARALLLLRGSITAREVNRGAYLPDGNGNPWSANVLRLERMVEQAKGARAIRAAMEAVIHDLEPLTGLAREADELAGCGHHGG